MSIEELTEELAIVERWWRDYHEGTLRQDNETAREQQFNQDFFVRILGYRMKPGSPFTIEPKASTEAGRIPDARLGIFGPDADDTSAVVELKGARTPLDKPQRGHGNLSPVSQGFQYRSHYRNTSFVIVSNFYETRLYNDNQLDYDSWTLDDLVDDADDYLSFKTFYLLLHERNLLRHGGASETEKMLSSIRTTQQAIGKSFYADYSKARAELLADLFEHNARVREDPAFGIEKAQKIIDRMVFACFAEDRGLLPDNTLHQVIANGSGSMYSMWSMVKQLFSAIDSGDSRLEIPVGYNGGLFAPDRELDSLLVSDESARTLLNLGVRYDFERDLSVNILGHIFEQSISDLERLREEVTAGPITSASLIAAGSRKSSGIYYTPEYIVRHLVDQTVGSYLRAEEQRILSVHGVHDSITDVNYEKRQATAYAQYQSEVLVKIRILDAACGSGAFLTAAFDFLMAEHHRVSTILGNDIYSNELLTGMVLRSNLFGVDLNAESTEITKLSLWLKSAKKNTPLEGLDQNIRVGNSLLAESTRDGDKAFNWETEFLDDNGTARFDVIVMNPPYIKEYENKDAFDGLRSLPVYQGKMDLWYAFGALALDLIRPETGRIAFIAPANWVTNAGASKFRTKVVDEARFIAYWDFGDTFVFSDAGIQTMVYVMQRSNAGARYTFPYARLETPRAKEAEVRRFLEGAKDPAFTRFITEIDRDRDRRSVLTFNDAQVSEALERIELRGDTVFEKTEIAQGIVAPQDSVNRGGAAKLGDQGLVGTGIFVLTDEERASLNLSAAELTLVKPFYTSAQLGRFYADQSNLSWVIYTDSSYKDRAVMEKFPRLKAHLDRYADVITSSNGPYGLHRARAERFFNATSILSLRKSWDRPIFTFADFDCYASQSYNLIQTGRFDPLGLTGLLNSRLVAFWLRFRGKMQGSLYQVDKEPLMSIPLIAGSDLSGIAGWAKAINEAYEQLRTIDSALRATFDSLSPGWTTANKHWWDMNESAAVSSLGSAVPMARHGEALQLFIERRRDARLAIAGIAEAESAIDELVYGLYGTSPADQMLIERHIQKAVIELP